MEHGPVFSLSGTSWSFPLPVSPGASRMECPRGLRQKQGDDAACPTTSDQHDANLEEGIPPPLNNHPSATPYEGGGEEELSLLQRREGTLGDISSSPNDSFSTTSRWCTTSTLAVSPLILALVALLLAGVGVAVVVVLQSQVRGHGQAPYLESRHAGDPGNVERTHSHVVYNESQASTGTDLASLDESTGIPLPSPLTPIPPPTELPTPSPTTATAPPSPPVTPAPTDSRPTEWSDQLPR